MEIFTTTAYRRWYDRLKDLQAKSRIDIALRRCTMAGKIVGDAKSVGDGVKELRIHRGPGYRIYYLEKADTVMLLLIGGDKTSQARDIDKAKEIAKEIKEEGEW